MRTIDELLAEAPTFAGLEPGHLEFIAGCAVNRVYADGTFLMGEGETDDAFYVLRRGAVALEIAAPQGAITIETLHEHEIVGWSWLVPPYRSHFDVRAVGDVHVIAFDAACLRGKCEEDPTLGYELYKRFAQIIVERLQATRLRLLDVYGSVAGG